MKSGADTKDPHPSDGPDARGDLTGPGSGPPPDAVGLHSTPIGKDQLYIVAVAGESEEAAKTAGAQYGELATLLSGVGMEILHERIFASLSVREAVLASRARALEAAGMSSRTPVTYIEGHPPWGEGFAGAQVLAVTKSSPDSDIWTIMDGDTPRGRGWKYRGTTFLYLHDLHGLVEGSAPGTRAEQTRVMIERAEEILRGQGATYDDVVRTWFYLNDILDWYDDFNVARSAKYGELGIMPKEGSEKLSLPASTGIEGTAPHHSAGSMDLLAAFGPPGCRPDIRQLSNVGQKDAFAYGSAFSRGAVICEPEACVLQLSGTAAIDEFGATIHVDDPRAQIECTLDKIEVLLRQEGTKLSEVVAATAFVKKPAYADLFWKIIAERGLIAFPAVCMVADVCRHDLLFEMDGEVIFHHEH